MKRLENGDISFPKRGKPPPDLPNYERDTSDPFLFHPKFIECQFRILESEKLPCGRVNCAWRCTLKGCIVSVPFCNVCDIPNKIEENKNGSNENVCPP